MDDATFFAWLDGELPPDEADRVAAKVAADPELMARADAHRVLGARLRDVFAPVAESPVPASLLAAAELREPRIVDLAAERERRAARSIPAGAQWAVMAATLAIGFVAGAMINGGAAGPITREDGRLVAAAELEQALDTRLASVPADSGPRIGLTFRDRSGSICRTFTDGGSSGLACRQGEDWRIRGLFQSGEGRQGEYRMAAGSDPRLADLVEATMAGEPLDAASERRAKEKGWR